MRRHLLILALTLAAACSSGPGPALEPRTFRLGFSATPPRLSVESVLETIEAWRSHADIALITQTVPWRALLADTSAATLVRRDVAELAQWYRSHHLPIIAQLDVTDGLAREREAPELLELGRSITEPAVQALYREYVLAFDSIVHPDYLGLAMETNLIRVAAPANVYVAVREMTNAAAVALEVHGSTADQFVSVQVETAWGRLPHTGQFVGVEQDRADFPFMDVLGLSSYPFLGGFAEPEEVPLDYYARLNDTESAPLPLLVVEGGWSSASVPGVTSSPERQARWIRRQITLADRGALRAVTQITFTDLDVTTYPMPPGSILPLFAHLGLVDVELDPKPALGEWDRALARPLRAPDD